MQISSKTRTGGRAIREVWAWNFQDEFRALLDAASCDGAVLAIDTEFPGVAREGPWWSNARPAQYDALRCSVDLLRPIQIGIAVAHVPPQQDLTSQLPGVRRPRPKTGLIHRGVWTFNLFFDLLSDHHTEASISFLTRAGVDFPRHAAEGIDAAEFGRRMATSRLVGPCSPTWLTFSGLYDLGYLLKMLRGLLRPLPKDLSGFDEELEAYCPRRMELRDWLPFGSLENLSREHGIVRRGVAHTAGSDALVTLELLSMAVPAEDVEMAFGREVSAAVVSAGVALKAAAFARDVVAAREEVRPRAAPSSTWAASARWAMIGSAAEDAAMRGAPRRNVAPPSVWGAAAREAAAEAAAEARLAVPRCSSHHRDSLAAMRQAAAIA
mmetsp:Transcript_61020/g.175794  ORF Transcript_61020/g.175794 Transcript_61020/m.175794 type:complete len:381 (+) Transcript_61020:91-1233(+)